MPWLETVPMDQRDRFIFITDQQHGLYGMTELCARYGSSRKTGDKWLARFEAGSRPALRERSHAPHHCPHRRVAEDVAELLCAARAAHPAWGPAKLLDWLTPRHPERTWPAVSTAGDRLARRGLVQRRRRRRPSQHPGVVPPTTTEPNDLWTVDFKGQFRTRDGIYCYPLTLASRSPHARLTLASRSPHARLTLASRSPHARLTLASRSPHARLTLADQHTRDLLACQGLRSTKGHQARRVLEWAVRTYGLPRAIRSDNGVPFATTGIHGLSQLNGWWLRLGIQHQRILPGQPQQNGAHERMHRTLKAEAIRPPRGSLGAQQRAFNAFRRLYHEERPHTALAGQPPASQYVGSPRPSPSHLPALEYPGHFVVKRVTNAGTFRFKDRLLFIANALTQHHIGLEESADGVWSIYLGAALLARVDERDYIIRG